MINKVLEYIKQNKILEYNDSVLLGVSGGADSICMLHVLSELKSEWSLKLNVVHINHMIRGEAAQRDADYVKKICDDLGISFEQINIDVPALVKMSGMTEEEAGRQARYETFLEMAETQNIDKIAVAHNLNDNSETVLFNLFRGTGIKGLTGIPVKRDKIIRPLLCCTRAEIERYLKEKNIEYCTDATNAETEYTRNKIRLELLPYIKENINQKAEYNIVNASKNLEEISDFMEKETQKAYDMYVEDGLLSDKGFKLHTAVLNMIIRKVIEQQAGKLKDITKVHVQSVMKLKDMEVSKKVNLPYGLIAERTYDGILVKQSKEKKVEQINETLITNGKICNNNKVEISFEKENFDMENIPELVCTKWFDYDKINELTIRNRQEGDYFVIDDTGRRKKLKDYFINEKVPREERDDILLIADGSHIVWIIGYRMSAYYKVTKSTSKIIKINYKE